MDLSGNESGSNSEEDHDVDKVISNARVPETEDEEETGESSQEEEHLENEENGEAEEKSESEEDAESESETEAESAVVTDVVKKVEPTITKNMKNNFYRDIILSCFNHYPKEAISLSKIKSYAHTVHNIIDSQEIYLKRAMKKLLNDEVIKNMKGKPKILALNKCP